MSIISFSIVPPSYEKGIPRILRAGMLMLCFPVMFALLWCLDIISQMYCIVFSSVFAIIIIYLLFLSLRYYRIATSRAFIYEDRLEVRDRRGNAWRIIWFSNITDIKILEIEGFMHGYHGVSGIAKYIVIFVNDCTSLPVNSFFEKYRDPNFFPIFYKDDVLDHLLMQMRGGKCTYGYDQLDG